MIFSTEIAPAHDAFHVRRLPRARLLIRSLLQPMHFATTERANSLPPAVVSVVDALLSLSFGSVAQGVWSRVLLLVLIYVNRIAS